MEKKALAEFIGTATLVFFGCGAAVIGGTQYGAAGIPFIFAVVGISLAFGLAIVAMAYGIGPISGCHVNPAVSIAAVAAGRMTPTECAVYIAAQCAGAIAGAMILLFIASGTPGYDASLNGLGQNGWGENYLGEYTTASAFTFELFATFIFVIVILGATQAKAAVQFAGLAIGLALVLIHLVGISITGTSVNPARSLGPALVLFFADGQSAGAAGVGADAASVGRTAMSQLWLFIIAPVMGAILAGLLFRQKHLEA
jgi:aquaporin Z